MATSVAKKRTDEQRTQAMKELTALPCNKKCLECHQLGPVYADITIASFVCTTCSGYLRGLNPPHRVKSISMTTFTDAEVDMLTKGGNDVANQVWLGRWDPKQDREPDKKNPVVFKEYLVAKYERKQWYTEPGEHREEPKAVSTPPTQSKLPGPPKVEKTRVAVGGSAGSPLVQTASVFTVSSAASAGSAGVLSSATATPTTQASTAAAAASSSSGGGSAAKVDLFGGLENDPFGPIQIQGSNMPTPTASVGPSLVPSGKAPDAPAKGAGATSAPPPAGTAPAASSHEDRYAALASLDMTLKEIKTKEEEEQHQRELLLQQEQQQRELLLQQQQLHQQQQLQQQQLQQQQFQQQQFQQQQLHQQQFQQQQLHQQQFQQQQFQGQFGAPNPFGAVTAGSSGQQQYSNPFGGAAQQQASFGMPHQGSQQFGAFGQPLPAAVGGQQQWAQQSPASQQQWSQQGMGGVAQSPAQQGLLTQQGFPGQQSFAGAQGFMGQQVAVGGASRVPPTQQMGLGPQQQQSAQAGVARGFSGQQPGVANSVQTQQLSGGGFLAGVGAAGFGGPQQGSVGAASFGGTQQGSVGAASFGGTQQGSVGAASFGGTQQGSVGAASFGGTQQGSVGAASFGGPQQGSVGAASFGGTQQGSVGAAGFGGPVQTQQQSAQQFGNFVASGAAGMPQQADKAGARGAQNVSTSSSDASLGWSTTMNKPVALPQSAPPPQATPTGWSSGMNATVQTGGGWGTSPLFGGSTVSQGAGQSAAGSFGAGQAGAGSFGSFGAAQAGAGSFGAGQAGAGSFGSFGAAQAGTGSFGAGQAGMGSFGSLGATQAGAGSFGASTGSFGSAGLWGDFGQQMSSPASQPSQQQVANPFAPQKVDSSANPFF